MFVSASNLKGESILVSDDHPGLERFERLVEAREIKIGTQIDGDLPIFAISSARFTFPTKETKSVEIRSVFVEVVPTPESPEFTTSLFKEIPDRQGF
jgi:hypothetical protein